ncbi:LysR family transcriptional regulator [Candidatus Thiothrix anitrata]|uniref:LysR family transcriptional regulator n=1 Tax=Candidatus Thiothrix anitrata TaxID=2823902 RepID=A0ABX7X3Q2_9GAMM|nr:LysR family transcriptional regulator [Candidatus Thiothrix anitrata]QTR50512.1 LysR family transcriptional regulator [Candidatus Thiothrix anitrata]
MSRLDYMANFVAVVDKGSITAAADQLELTVAAVSKRLKMLETELGVRLLTRNTRQLSLTEAGHYYYQHCREIQEEVNRVDQHLLAMQGKLSGELRINMPMTYGKVRLTKLLIRFLQQHPDIHLTAHLDDAYTDAASGDYDVVIRIGVLDDSRLVARKLENAYLLPVAAPAYLQTHGTPRTPAELAQHQCLHYTNVSHREGWTFYDQAGNASNVQIRGQLCANNGEVLKQAAIAGMGVALLPDFELIAALEKGELVRILPDYSAQTVSVYAVYPSRQFLPEKTRVLVDFLISTLQIA